MNGTRGLWLAAGYAGIEERLGVDLRGKLDLLLRFEDAGEREVDRGSTSTIARGGKPAMEILFRTEYVVVRDANFAAARMGADARNAWLAEKGEADWKAWLAKHRGHLLELNARYRLGKAYIYAGRYEEGRERLRKVVAEDFDRSSVCDDAAYWIAQSFERQASEACGVLLRDCSWASSSAASSAASSPGAPRRGPASSAAG